MEADIFRKQMSSRKKVKYFTEMCVKYVGGNHKAHSPTARTSGPT